MKNYEKYEDEIRNYNGDEFCVNFVQPYILKENGCASINCEACFMYQMIWLLKDYEEPEEPEIDWSKVEVDTPILVREYEEQDWVKRHFAKYEDGFVYAWRDSCTSWTVLHDEEMSAWKYAKLPEDKKKPETDWSKVEVDTPILVRQDKNGEWLERHFAKYENGDVYAWDNGHTSNESSCMVYCKYAKLAENEKKCEESEIDWSKVKVDTPILVRDSKDNKWLERYFAKYEDGLVYAWLGENTSYTTCSAAKWKYAKLVEDEKGDN